MIKIYYFLASIALVLCQSCASPGLNTSAGSKNSISNYLLTVTFDVKSRSLSVIRNSDNKTFIRNLIPYGATSAFRKEVARDSAFGAGNSLIISTEGGGTVSFALYPSQPFLFINQSVINSGESVLDIQNLNPVSFSVDLNKPATELKTLGTGGLLSPDNNPGSYVFLTTVDPVTRNGVVTGWLTNEKGSGVVFSGIKDNLVEIKARIEYGHFRLPSGKSETTETLLIGYFDDARSGEEQFADAIVKQQNIRLKPRSATYCTWYSEKNGGAGSESSTLELTSFISSRLKSFGLEVIQIDDKWQGGGPFNGPQRGFDRTDPKGGYPNGMKITADAIRKEGLTAGIWWMPFARNHQAPEYKNRQHWFAYRPDGKPFETAWGGTSLDLTLPEVQNHISEMAKTLHGWGYNYFKMDGLWTGTVTEQVYINDGYKNDSIGNSKPLFNPFKTQIEAFRDGLKILRKAAGDEVFFSGCCVSQNMRSFGASFGLVNSMRIGPDYNADGEGIRTGVIRASRLYFLNGKVWWNDPDPSILRGSGKSAADPSVPSTEGLSKSRMLPSFVAVSGQFFLSSDWLPDLPDNRLEIMKRCMASHNGYARPVDAFDKPLPSVWLASDSQTGTPRNVIGLFNWDTTALEIVCPIARTGLDDKTAYYAFDFWENKTLPDVNGLLTRKLPPESCSIIAVRPRSGHPVVVSTSQHVTQGMIDLLLEEWKDGTLSGTSMIIGGDNYELRIAGINDGGNHKVTEVKVIDPPQETSIEVLPQTEKGWLRVLIKTKKSEIVNWQIKFD
jgi:hypothetical protein